MLFWMVLTKLKNSSFFSHFGGRTLYVGTVKPVLIPILIENPQKTTAQQPLVWSPKGGRCRQVWLYMQKILIFFDEFGKKYKLWLWLLLSLG